MRRVKFKAVRIVKRKRLSIFTRGSYTLDYPENSVVRAIEGTLGVAVFKTRKQSEEFLKKTLGPYQSFKTIRVRPIGRGRTVKYVCDYPSEAALNKFYSYSSYRKRLAGFRRLSTPPPGTIFYPEVEVLD